VNPLKIRENMEVFGSCGNRFGTVTGIEGNLIKLDRVQPATGGEPHYIPFAWVNSIDQNVRLDKSCNDLDGGRRRRRKKSAHPVVACA
jgi:hypothetical protein